MSSEVVMSRLTDEQLWRIFCDHWNAPVGLRAVADAAVAAYIKQKNIELPVAKRWKAEVPKSQGGGHIWVYISRDEKVPEGAYWEPLFTNPLPADQKEPK